MGKRNINFKLMVAGVLFCTNACMGLAVPVSAADGWEIDLKNYADTLGESSISISIGGANNEILNADKGIAQGMIKQTANIEFGATNGYTVKISGTPNLTGASTKATIPSAALTLGNMVNQWGWYAVSGVANCSETNVYKAMTSAGTQIDSGVLADGGTKTYTMCFGMRVNGNQAADTYNGSVTVSAVAEPGMVRTAPFSGITYMQDMTANICKLADENETAQLIDRRDNKKYWVTKLLDGNCWMSQNLDLDITTTNITTASSDVTEDWTSSSAYPPQVTTSSVATGTTNSAGTYSWDLGDYVIIAPTITATCGNNTGLAACTGQFTAVGSRTPSSNPNFYRDNGNKTYTDTEYDTHYLVGNYYQWNAATAGTGGGVTGANANGSICPKGWGLPSSGDTSGNMTNGSFRYLLSQYGVESQITGNGREQVDGGSIVYSYNITLNPLFFARYGVINLNGGSSKLVAGGEGEYISSTAQANASYAYGLYVGSSSVAPSGNGGGNIRHYGQSVRCLFLTT